jgi:hypothetical protein
VIYKGIKEGEQRGPGFFQQVQAEVG